MPTPILIGAGFGLAGAGVGAWAASNAADTAADSQAATNAQNYQMWLYEQQKKQPYLRTGGAGLSMMEDMMGVTPIQTPSTQENIDYSKYDLNKDWTALTTEENRNLYGYRKDASGNLISPTGERYQDMGDGSFKNLSTGEISTQGLPPNVTPEGWTAKSTGGTQYAPGTLGSTQQDWDTTKWQQTWNQTQQGYREAVGGIGQKPGEFGVYQTSTDPEIQALQAKYGKALDPAFLEGLQARGMAGGGSSAGYSVGAPTVNMESMGSFYDTDIWKSIAGMLDEGYDPTKSEAYQTEETAMLRRLRAANAVKMGKGGGQGVLSEAVGLSGLMGDFQKRQQAFALGAGQIGLGGWQTEQDVATRLALGSMQSQTALAQSAMSAETSRYLGDLDAALKARGLAANEYGMFSNEAFRGREFGLRQITTAADLMDRARQRQLGEATIMAGMGKDQAVTYPTITSPSPYQYAGGVNTANAITSAAGSIISGLNNIPTTTTTTTPVTGYTGGGSGYSLNLTPIQDTYGLMGL